MEEEYLTRYDRILLGIDKIVLNEESAERLIDILESGKAEYKIQLDNDITLGSKLWKEIALPRIRQIEEENNLIKNIKE